MKQIKNYPDYYITEDGKVYSKKYHYRKNPNCELREMKLIKNNRGYLRVAFFKDGKPKNFRVHRLIAECYIPNPDNLPEIDHIDDNKLNNHMSNLEWVTSSENKKRAKENGLIVKGEKLPQSKLTEEEVKWIRKNYIPYHKEFGTRALGRKFNVHCSQISLVINYKTWKHI